VKKQKRKRTAAVRGSVSLAAVDRRRRRVSIQDHQADNELQLPAGSRRSTSGGFSTPVRYTVNLDHVSFRGASPQLDLRS
jgi:hypothetical protein